MGRYVKNLLTVALALTGATVLFLALPALAETSCTLKPGALLLVQDPAPPKENAPCPAPPPQKPGQAKSVERPAPRLEKKSRKIEGSQQPPGAAGTKKLGGQLIRDKEVPDGD
jgi:hypothetical protein